MSRPLHRGSSGIQIPENNKSVSLDSQMKDKAEKEDGKRGYLDQRFHSSRKGDSFNTRYFHKLTLLPLKISLVLITMLALTGSFWWAISISSSPRAHILHGYRRIQEKIASDLHDIGELSLGSTRLKELEFCSQQSEYFVPCFNISENIARGDSAGDEYDRYCGYGSRQNCLAVSPANYKVPLKWPTGRDVIWIANVKITAQEVLSSGSLTKRMMMMEEEQISFRSASLMFDSVEDYSHQIAEMIGLRNDSSFVHVGIRTILDVGCGYGSFGAHLFSKQLLTMCIANYEASGSQVQLTLERGLPAMIGSFISKQLPYPSLSFDMIHCARCGVDWVKREGFLLIEVDRLLRPGGYFVWTSPLTNPQSFRRSKGNQEKWNFVRVFAENICWDMLSQQDETVVWKKTVRKKCYVSRRPSLGPSLCGKGRDLESPYYRPLEDCISGTHNRRWIPIEERLNWPNRAKMNSTELQIYGVHIDEFTEDMLSWNSAVRNYWSLLSPLIFSDHPKRPGDEDPSPPYNMVRNVLDMNARFGGFNYALLEAGKSVWVMNVVPTSGPNYLPLILDRGFIGVLHDWCEAFPTYPRTYDMVYAEGLLLHEANEKRGCTTLHLFTEIDRILRPEGWVIVRDTVSLVESARALATRLKWDARVVQIEHNNAERLLVCQKPFIKKQAP